MRHIAGLVLTGILAIAAEIPQDGLKAEMASKWDEAATIYENILKKEPTRTDLYVRLSNIYAKEKQFDKAADAINRAIAIDPKQADLYVRLASVYAVLNQPERALATRDKTLELEPNNVTYLVAHARIANWLKKSDIAAESLKKALTLDPANEDLLLLLSQSSEWAKKSTEAITYYQKYLDRNPENLRIWLVLANLQSLQGNVSGSNDTLKKAYARFVGATTPIEPILSRPLNVSIPILEYHCIDDTAPNMYWVATSEFEAQMDELVKNGYHAVTMDTISKAMKGTAALPEKPIAITFDDGCQNLYTKAFPILKKKGLNAEVYVVTDSMGNSDADRKSSATAKLGENGENSLTYYLTWPEVKEMSDSGWGIGSHSRAHMDMSELNATSLTHEILYSKLAILGNVGVNPISFSYPYGYGNGKTTIHNELITYGYSTAAASTGGVAQLNTPDTFNIPRIMIYGPKPSIDPQSKGVSVTENPSRPNDRFMAKIEPNDAEKAYEKGEYLLASQKYREALVSINEAVSLAPNTIRYLNSQLQIAGIANDSFVAAEAATQIYTLEPTDENLLSLARAYQWNNRLDKSATYYQQYLGRHMEQKEVWTEYAQLQVWLGRYADALALLASYKDKFGTDTSYLDVKSQALSWGERPRDGFVILDSILKNTPNDYNANYTKTVALSKNLQPVEAVESLVKVEKTRPEAVQDNTFLRKYITTDLRPSVTAGLQYYSDSYHVSDRTGTLNGEYHLTPVSGLDAQVRMDALHATNGSGYQQDNGEEKAYYRSAMIGYNSRTSQNFAYRAAIGGAKAENQNDVTYKVTALWSPLNTFSLNMGYGHDFYVISPRTVGRGIKDNRAEMSMHWEPTMKMFIDASAQNDWLSDDNRRWEINIAPKMLVARTQYWNLDVGPTARFYGYTNQYEDHGYYSPKLIQAYYASGYFYWKKSDNDGVGLVISAGTVHDSYANTSKLGGGAALEGIFGMYKDWMLKANMSVDYNSRYTNQSYIGTNYSIFLTRRF